MEKRLVIIGSGESGIGAALLGMEKQYDVFVSESGKISNETKSIFDKKGIRYEEEGHTHQVFQSDLVIKSPGVTDSAEVIRSLRKRGKDIISEIEFGYRFIDNAKIVAITGTNGKTTTTLLTYHLLKDTGYKVALAGNIGVSLSRLVARGGFHYYVVEVSSFQLDGIVNFKPDIAVLLNITPDHLDRYDYDFTNYVKSKFRITENLSRNECLIYCAESIPISEELIKRRIEATRFAITFSKKHNAKAYMANDHLVIDYKYNNKGIYYQVPMTDITLIGKHNMVNVMASVLCALNLDTPIKTILKGLKTFQNPKHRLEIVDNIKDVRYINDSKATNVDSVFHALDGINKKIVWIAGGMDKGNDYSSLKSLVADKVGHLICIGKDNKRLKKAFTDFVQIHEVQEMSDAVMEASQLADKGDVVLLSPACSSFDRFKNFEDRGSQFKTAVGRLKQKIKP